MRRTLLLTTVLLCGTFVLPSQAADKEKPVVSTLPDGVVVTGAGGGGGGTGNGSDGSGGSGGTTRCPGYESVLSAPAQGPQIGPDGGYYAWEKWRFPPGEWASRSVCVYRCPPGVPTTPYIPPPSLPEIQARFARYVIAPLGRFAPPVEKPEVKAIVGMRFYYSVDPTTFQTIAPPPEPFPGGWQVTATLTPGKISYTAGDITSSCDGPNKSGRTKTGRNSADRQGCFVIFETVPETGRLDSTLTTEWTITVVSTTVEEFVGQTWTTLATTSYNIGLRELQAVGTAN